MFLFAQCREGRVTAPPFQFLFYLMFFRTISHAFPQRELPSNAAGTSIPESPTILAGGPGGFSEHPNTAHLEQSATALGDATTAVPIFPSISGTLPVDTTAAPLETAPIPEGPIVTPNIPHIESTADGLDPPTTAIGTTGNPEQTEPEIIATPTCLSCDIEVTVTGLDFPTTPAAEIAGNSNGTPVTQPPSPPATITAGSSAIQINQDSSGFLIGTQTVSAGQTISVQGTPIVIQTSNGQTQVVVGSSTVLLSPSPSAQGQITAAPLIIAGQTITANSAGGFIIGTQTLAPGGPAITVSGTTISLPPSGSIAVINSVTPTLAPGPAQATAKPGPPLLTLNGHTYTANSATQYVIGPDATLTPGGVVTINGTVVSLSPSETDIVVGGTTSLLGAGTATGTGVGAGATARSTHSSAGAARARGTGTAR
ncbi:hypothetical protein V2W45_1347657 [Cenococcum geophilum]